MSNEQKIEAFWRDATAADVARVMNGEEVEARFRDYDGHEWQCCGLAGWYRNGVLNRWRWATSHMVYYLFCQVYDPPQWWLDKPEPGEEYRLLKKFPAEDLQGGDEVFRRGKGFEAVHYWHSGGKQIPDIWYRRKIELPKPEPKHYELQVGDTISVPSGHRITVTELGIGVQ